MEQEMEAYSLSPFLQSLKLNYNKATAKQNPSIVIFSMMFFLEYVVL